MFNSRFRDKLLDRDWFTSLAGAKVMSEDDWLEYNHRRPHSRLGNLPPARFVSACDGALLTGSYGCFRSQSMRQLRMMEPHAVIHPFAAVRGLMRNDVARHATQINPIRRTPATIASTSDEVRSASWERTA